MSTRGFIGLAEGDGVRGRYNHSDSYPTYLGKLTWAAVTGFPTPQQGVAALREFLTTGPGRLGISFIGSADFLANPQVIDWSGSGGEGNIGVYNRPDDPGEEDWITGCDLWVEWGYAFNDLGVSVFTSVKDQSAPDGYGTTLVGTYRFDDGEPDWAAVEARGGAMAEQAEVAS